MLVAIFKFYIEGLVVALLTSILVVSFWMLYRARRGLETTAKSKKAMLYDALLLVLVMTPILSFAFMAIILMLSA